MSATPIYDQSRAMWEASKLAESTMRPTAVWCDYNAPANAWGVNPYYVGFAADPPVPSAQFVTLFDSFGATMI